jgi:serine protease Do
VLPGSPAERAGLRAGDLIYAVGDRAVDDSTRLQHAIARAPIGEPLRLRLVREGKEHEVQVVVVERPAPRGAVPTSPDGGDEASPSDGVGITARALTPDLAEALGWERTASGVVVTGVEPGSPAAQQGIRPGLVLQEIDRRPIRTLDDLTAAVGAIDARRGVLLRVWDGDASTFVLVKPLR